MDRVLGWSWARTTTSRSRSARANLLIRIRKQLSRARTGDDQGSQLRIGDIQIDVPRHVVQVGTKGITLTATSSNFSRSSPEAGPGPVA